MKTPLMIGIAGGSGTGKTTIAQELQKILPAPSVIIHCDNYQKFDQELARIDGMKNFDHPDAIYWDRLLIDLASLIRGKSISMAVRDQKTLVASTDQEIIQPREIMIIEGYLLLHDPAVRRFLDLKVFLDSSDATRMKRRTKGNKANYLTSVLLPMHHQYVAPTKQFADLVISTEHFTPAKCAAQILAVLR